MQTMICSCITLLLTLLTEVYATVDQLEHLQKEFWKWRMKDSPIYMSLIGNHRHDDLLESFDVAIFEERKNTVEKFSNKLKTIPYEFLTHKAKIDYLIFEDYLNTYLEGYRWKSYMPLNPINFLEGFQTNVHQLSQTIRFTTHGDFVNYLERLRAFPRMIKDIQESMAMAIRLNRTLHQASIEKVPIQIEAFLKDTPTNSSFYQPFGEKLQEMPNISTRKKQKWREEAEELIKLIQTAIEEFGSFLVNTYMSKTRPLPGVSYWTGGKDFYKACLKFHLTDNTTPEEVHHMGLQEVKRIENKMLVLLQKIGRNGPLPHFFKEIQSDPYFNKGNGNDMIKEFEHMYYRRIKPVLSKFFSNIPDKPMKMEPMPFDSGLAYYLVGDPDGERPSTFYINTKRPAESPVMKFMALTVHEAEPGHHLQLSIAVEANLPAYRRHLEIRKYFQVPFTFPFFTAFTEGWGTYAEFLAEEMGLYKDEYELLGRYEMEITRACRMVVDTGLHYFNWSRERAIEYLREYTALSLRDATNEIDRYISIPGQACAYKYGEIKLRDIRRKAKSALGPDFNIKEFHRVVLENGAMPLRILDKIVSQWTLSVKSGEYDTDMTSQNSVNSIFTSGGYIYLLFYFLFFVVCVDIL